MATQPQLPEDPINLVRHCIDTGRFCLKRLTAAPDWMPESVWEVIDGLHREEIITTVYAECRLLEWSNWDWLSGEGHDHEDYPDWRCSHWSDEREFVGAVMELTADLQKGRIRVVICVDLYSWFDTNEQEVRISWTAPDYQTDPEES